MSATEKENFDLQDIAYTSIFILDMVVHFKVSEATKNQEAKKKAIKKSFFTRLGSSFKDRIFVDIISLVPLPFLLRGWVQPHYNRLLYLLKVVRL